MPTVKKLQEIIEQSIIGEPFFNEKGELMAYYDGDEDFPYGITIRFNVSGNILYVMAEADDFKIPSKKTNSCFSLINFLNRTTPIIKVSFVKTKEFLFESKLFSELLITENVNNDYISDFINYTIENVFSIYEKIYNKI